MAGRRRGRSERNVRQPFAVQPQHLQVHDVVDEGAHPPDELVLVGDEGEQHADGEGVFQHTQGAEPDHNDCQRAQQQHVAGAEHELQLLRGQLPVQRFHQQVQPVGAAVFLTVEQLDGPDAAQRLEEMAVPARRPDDGLHRSLVQRRVEHPAQQTVQRSARQHDSGQ